MFLMDKSILKHRFVFPGIEAGRKKLDYLKI